MLYGMGTVFVFLTILVFATVAMSALVKRFSNDEPATSAEPASTQVVSNKPEPDVIEAIKHAIAQHRTR